MSKVTKAGAAISAEGIVKNSAEYQAAHGDKEGKEPSKPRKFASEAQRASELAIYGPKLLARGYPIIPILAGKKHPGIDKWQETVASESDIAVWVKSGHRGLGVQAKNFPGVDIDIGDIEVSKKMIRYVTDTVGAAPIRVGMPPRALLSFRAEQPFSKMVSNKYMGSATKEENVLGKKLLALTGNKAGTVLLGQIMALKKKRTHQVEILGDGQQWVAYHIHPDTNQAYKYIGKPELCDIPAADLPVLTVEKARKIINHFESTVPDDWQVIDERGHDVEGSNQAYKEQAEAWVKFNEKYDVTDFVRDDELPDVGKYDLGHPDDVYTYGGYLLKLWYELSAADKTTEQSKITRALPIEYCKDNSKWQRMMGGYARSEASNREEEFIKLSRRSLKDTHQAVSDSSLIYRLISMLDPGYKGRPATMAGVIQAAQEGGYQLPGDASVGVVSEVSRQPVGAPAYSNTLPFNRPIQNPKAVFDNAHLKFTKEGHLKTVLGTRENMIEMLKQYGVEVVFNEVTRREMYAVKGAPETEDDKIIDAIVSLCELNGLPKGEIVPRLRGIAREFKYNPVINYLEGLPVAKTGTIERLTDCVTVAKGSKKLFRKILRLWMIQCCAAADRAQRTPNRQAIPRYEHILVFSSAQGVKKTKFFRALAQCVPGVFKDGLMLNPSKTDSITQATGLWIAELGEIDSTFKKGKISELKAFLSSTEDIYRLPYARAAVVEPRHTSYCGTVNDLKFLRDTTGNRRYWSFEVLKIDLPGQALVNAAWSEAWSEYLAGQQWWAGNKLEKKMRKHTMRFEEIPDVVQDVLRSFKPATGNNGRWMSAKELLLESGYDFASGYMPPHLRQQVDGYLQKDGWKSRTRSRMTFWYVC